MASQFPEDRPQPVTPPPHAATPAATPAEGMVARAKSLLLTPEAEWRRIDAEPMTVKAIMIGWAAPLAAIGPLAALIGTQVFGFRVFGIVYRPPLGNSLATAVVSYVTALIGVYVLALVIDNVAPSFGARRDMVAATKVAVFSFTAAWLAGIFTLVPQLAVLGLVGLYSLYLLWIGLPILMKPPADKAQTYAVVAIACGIIAYVVVSYLVGLVSDALTPPVTSVGSISVR